MINNLVKNKLTDVIEEVIDNRGRNPSHYASSGYLVLDNYLIQGLRYPDENLVHRFIDEGVFKNFLRKYLRKNDICITLVGNGIGNLCMIPSERWVTIQNSIGLRTNGSNDQTYLYYYLKLNRKAIIALDRGSSQPSILQGDLLNLKIEIHKEKSIQRSIADMLSCLDDKISLNNRINAELEQTARQVYNYWFTQFDFPDDNGKPYKSSGGEMTYDKQLKREIPTGWQTILLKDVLEFEKGTEPGASAYSKIKKSNDYIKFYRVGDIDSETKTYVDSQKTNLKFVKPRDVIVTFDGTVGKIGIGLDGAISSGLRHIYDKTGKIDNSVIYLIFSDATIKAEILKYSTGSVLIHASKAIDYLTASLDGEVIEKFQNVVKPMYNQIVNNRQESAQLAQLRDWLLPMLMTGQVKVE